MKNVNKFHLLGLNSRSITKFDCRAAVVYQIKFRNVWRVKKHWSGAELCRYCCQWMEKASLCLCSHSGQTLQAILLQAVEKMDNWIKCQPKCQKCEKNVFLRVMLNK